MCFSRKFFIEPDTQKGTLESLSSVFRFENFCFYKKMELQINKIITTPDRLSQCKNIAKPIFTFVNLI